MQKTTQLKCQSFVLALFFQVTAAADLYIPQVVNGPNWTTTVRLTNLTGTPIGLTPRFVKADGSPWQLLSLLPYPSSGSYDQTDFEGTTAWSLYPYSSARFETVPGTLTETGYLVLPDVNPNSLLVSAFLDYSAVPGGPATARVALPASARSTWSSFPVEKDTAVAVLNPNEEPLLLSLSVARPDPPFETLPVESVIALEVAPKSQAAFFLREVLTELPDGPEAEGYANLWTPLGRASFVALPLLFPQNGIFTSIPVLKRKESDFSEKVPLLRFVDIENGFWRIITTGLDRHWRGRLLLPENVQNLEIATERDLSVSVVVQVSALGTLLCRPPAGCGKAVDVPGFYCSHGAVGIPVQCSVKNPQPGDWFVEVTADPAENVILRVNWH